MKREKSSWLIYFVLIFIFSNCATTPTTEKANSSKSITGGKAVSEPIDSIDSNESSVFKPSNGDTETTELGDSKKIINPQAEKNIDEEENQEDGLSPSGNLIIKNDDGLTSSRIVVDDNSSFSGNNEHSPTSVQNLVGEGREIKLFDQERNGTLPVDKEFSESLPIKSVDVKVPLNQKYKPVADQALSEINLHPERTNLNDKNDSTAVNQVSGSGLESYFEADSTDELPVQTNNIELSSERKSNLLNDEQIKNGFIKAASSPKDLNVSVSKIEDRVRTNKKVNPKVGSSSPNLGESSVVLSSQPELNQLNKLKNKVEFQSEPVPILMDEISRKVLRIGLKDPKDNLSFNKSQAFLKVRFKDEVDMIPENNNATSPEKMVKHGNTHNGYGNIRIFLNRNEESKSETNEVGEPKFNRVESYLNTDRNSTKAVISLEGQDPQQNRYEKTLKWINNRGRSFSESKIE